MDAVRLAELFWLMLPAYAANMAPPFVRFWKGWNRPLDERRLGAHKTILGVAAGVVAGLVAARIQHILHPAPLLEWEWPAFGFAQGAGAMAGDAIKSYFKRRRGLAPGARWIPADQLDFVAGALLLSAPGIALGWGDVAAVLAMSFVADIAVNHLACALHIRDTAW